MDIFGKINPFSEGSVIFDRWFILYESKADRQADSSSVEKRTDLVEFIATEPQMVQRVTENLLLIEELAAMQRAPYRIYTERTDITFHKGQVVTDQVTGKSYQILVAYTNVQGVDMTIMELDD